MDSEDLEALGELAQRLHVPVRKLALWAKRGELPGATLIGGRWRVKTRVVDRWIDVVGAAIQRKRSAPRPPFRPPTQEELIRQLLEAPPSALRDEILGKIEREQQRLTKRSK